MIITDNNVAIHYLELVTKGLTNKGIEVHSITVKAGEASKCMKVVEDCFDKLFDFNVERSDTVIALGGGVVGDLAGFVAASFKRGVSYIQFPTTLLAMVDSSIGGKTGINHPRGKNMIGAFHQPKLVFCDTKTLDTLPKRELSCGLAETIKHSVIRDKNFFEHLVENREGILSLESELVRQLVKRNCEIKASVVSEDEKESGLRGILNYGHTIGHTFETLLSHMDLHHGEAISRGMVAVTRIAAKRNMISESDSQRIIDLLEAYNLPINFDTALPVDDIYQTMQHDKKVTAGKINFVLPTAIGDCTFKNDLTEEEIKWSIESLQK